MNKKQEYLKSLSFWQLMDLYEDAIRHSHYCPCECHCFDNWKYKFDKTEVRTEINRLVGEAVLT